MKSAAARLSVILSALLPLAAAAAPSGPDAPRVETVRFAAGRSGRILTGRINGRQSVDYRIPAGAGQSLSAAFTAANPQAYFNLLPPGSEAAMFIGSSSGAQVARVLPVDGVYVLRVYLMRAAARRGEASAYSLKVAVTGKALPALPALPSAVDARIAGTPFHASATLDCTAGVELHCEAWVIRRGFDGTASVEIRAPGLVRRILFVKGEAQATDSTEALRQTRAGDTTLIDLGEEHYGIPDALLFGG